MLPYYPRGVASFGVSERDNRDKFTVVNDDLESIWTWYQSARHPRSASLLSVEITFRLQPFADTLANERCSRQAFRMRLRRNGDTVLAADLRR